MAGIAMYYLMLSVATLSISIYNFNSATTGKSLQCYEISEMDDKAYQNYLTYLGNKSESMFTAKTALDLQDIVVPKKSLRFMQSVTEVNANANANANVNNSTVHNNTSLDTDALSNTNSEIIHVVPIEKSNPLASMQQGIAVLYLIIVIFSMFMSCILNYLSNLVPDDFLNMGRVTKCFGSFCKLVPSMIIILHWIILLMIVIDWGFIGVKACQYSLPTQISGKFFLDSSQKYFLDSTTLSIVTSAIWIFLHYIGAIIRDIVYEEPFSYSPDLGKPSIWKKIFIKKLGP
jgi:hypothetical protein